MRPRPRTPGARRRGITLVEMLVSVALLVLMMTVIVQIFAAATTAVSASKTFQDLDTSLRQIESTLRSDLSNVTARFTPPLDPKNNLGYFEYGENSFADLQGEDADDYIRFTAKAPEGQFFTGRMYAPMSPAFFSAANGPTAAQQTTYAAMQPITVQSQYAEIIYFLRNGNLYRRVLLVAPEKQNAVNQTLMTPPTAGSGTFTVGAFGTGNTNIAGWQGVNDLSARPNPYGPAGVANTLLPVLLLNTLGDLTNRENRMFSPRFSPDFVTNSTGASPPDGLPDDQNSDSIHDFYPSLYYNLVNPNNGYYKNPVTGNQLVNEDAFPASGNPRSSVTGEMMAFPYTYAAAYTKPDNSGSALANGLGWIHTPDPSLDLTTPAGLQGLNHNPVDLGDSLPTPGNGSNASLGGLQTWLGFPLWRETLSRNWNDPIFPIQSNGSQPNGLHPPLSTSGTTTTVDASVYPPSFGTNALPPMDGSVITGTSTPVRAVPQPFTDGVGAMTFAAVPSPPFSSADLLWRQSWDDDLIATGVRSFDVKAYDDTFAGYVDLGWGDDLRIPGIKAASFLSATPLQTSWAGNVVSTYAQTFAHEGRIPPLSADNRADAQWPTFSPNIGDDTASIVRLRRVWDSWSTDYSYAPSNGVTSAGLPFGPPFSLPAYPSYPPPYPMPLRGIQIQIRMTDPRNERVKVLTIRQDFSDKL